MDVWEEKIFTKLEALSFEKAWDERYFWDEVIVSASINFTFVPDILLNFITFALLLLLLLILTGAITIPDATTAIWQAGYSIVAPPCQWGQVIELVLASSSSWSMVIGIIKIIVIFMTIVTIIPIRCQLPIATETTDRYWWWPEQLLLERRGGLDEA